MLEHRRRVVVTMSLPAPALSASAETAITLVPVNDAPVLQLGAQSASHQLLYQENAGLVPLVVVNAVQVTDADNATLTEIRVLVPELNPADQETLRVTLPDGSTVASIGDTVVVPGPLALAQATQVLKSLAYTNSFVRVPTQIRVFTVSVSDGLASTSAQVTVTFEGVNNPPELDLSGRRDGQNVTRAFVEESAAIPLLTQARIFDLDTNNLQSLTVEFTQAPPDGSALEQLAVLVDNSWAPPSATATGFTIAGDRPVVDYVNVLRTVTYVNLADEPATADPRVVRVTVSDGTDTSSAQFVVITVLPRNDAPTLDLDTSAAGLGFETQYIEGSGPVHVANGLDLTLTFDDAYTEQYVGAMSGRVQGLRSPGYRMDVYVQQADGTFDRYGNAQVLTATGTWTVPFAPDGRKWFRLVDDAKAQLFGVRTSATLSCIVQKAVQGSLCQKTRARPSPQVHNLASSPVAMADATAAMPVRAPDVPHRLPCRFFLLLFFSQSHRATAAPTPCCFRHIRSSRWPTCAWALPSPTKITRSWPTWKSQWRRRQTAWTRPLCSARQRKSTAARSRLCATWLRATRALCAWR